MLAWLKRGNVIIRFYVTCEIDIILTNYKEMRRKINSLNLILIFGSARAALYPPRVETKKKLPHPQDISFLSNPF